MLSLGLALALPLGVALVSSPCSAQHDDEAHGLFTAGAAAFSSGRYDEALEYFQRAYDLSGRAALLYNVGQAADRGRHDAIALDAFRRYLEANPDVENREEIEGRIRVLERAQTTQTSAPAPTDAMPDASASPDATATTSTEATAPREPVATTPGTTDPAPAASSGGGIDIAGLSLAVGGGVFLIAGAILVGIGAAHLDPVPPGASDATIQAHDNALIFAGVGGAALCVGVIAGVISAVILATSGSSSSQSSALRVGPGGLTLAF